MKTSAPVHVDRLAQALKAQGIDLKRSKVIEIAAAAFGFHNSNEFEAAAKAGDLTPPKAAPLGNVTLANGTSLLVLRDAQDLPYAVLPSALGQGRSSSVGITPYGGIVTLPENGEVTTMMSKSHSATRASRSGGSAGYAAIDLSTLGALIEAADAHAASLREDLEDDALSTDHLNAIEETLAGLDAAVIDARAATASGASQSLRDVSWSPQTYEGAPFSLVRNASLISVMRAARSHLADAQSGVAEHYYEASKNEWVADLEKAIDDITLSQSASVLHMDTYLTTDERANSIAFMAESVELLQAAKQPPQRKQPNSPSADDETIWLTDSDGEVTGDISREQLTALGLDYAPTDGRNPWWPLTDVELELLQPGSAIPSDSWSGKFLDVPTSGDAMEVQLGASCVRKGQKWLVPLVAFPFDEGASEEGYLRLFHYVSQIKRAVTELGGEVEMEVNASGHEHLAYVFLPMSLAKEFDGPEAWAQALQWLLCPSDSRHKLKVVTATFEMPWLRVTWDATFDILRAGRKQADLYLRGEMGWDATMRLAKAFFGRHNFWWITKEDWDLIIDKVELRRLYHIK
ncbi:hypothetical protein [Sphingomonas sp. 3-13AW]|uniref:hypothetical protein n=1 Tax=Sphingomonas sp. 3-13AW TaxID=3050450 RepID=UPI003BB6A18B